MEVEIRVGSVTLKGLLETPLKPKGLVLFAHGSGSGRLSPRNQFVAAELRKAGFATLLFDLLTPKEDEVYENRFNINRLAERLLAVTQWATKQKGLEKLGVGYFGASTGAASALQAAASRREIFAVVSRGGRPDLAASFLGKVKAPTLLIVGGEDRDVIEMNRWAFERLASVKEKELSIVPSATHLFEEPGTLEEVARLATVWFKRFLAKARA